MELNQRDFVHSVRAPCFIWQQRGAVRSPNHPHFPTMATTLGYNQIHPIANRPQSPPANCVLVVEDHEDTRFMLRTMLELRGGISVVEADNGELAIELAEKFHPDLILIDGLCPWSMATRPRAAFVNLL